MRKRMKIRKKKRRNKEQTRELPNSYYIYYSKNVYTVNMADGETF